ncbi:MAG: DUF4157 domain-containing protein [Nannocystaceae bacterium]
MDAVGRGERERDVDQQSPGRSPDAAPPLFVATPDHPLEVQATHAAHAVSRAHPWWISGRKSEIESPRGLMALDPTRARAVTLAQHQAVNGGQRLRPDVRTQLESRFGRSLTDVRIHTTTNAAAAAQAIGASGFTTGRDVFFRRDPQSPNTPSNRALLVHELSHTLQHTEPSIIFRNLLTSEPLAGSDTGLEKDERPCTPLEFRDLEASRVRSRALVLKARQRLLTIRGGKARRSMFGKRSVADALTMHGQLKQLADSLDAATLVGDKPRGQSHPRVYCSDGATVSGYNRNHTIVIRTPLPESRILDRIMIHEFAHSLLGVDVYAEDPLFHRLSVIAGGSSVHQRNADSWTVLVMFLASEDRTIHEFLEREGIPESGATVEWNVNPLVVDTQEQRAHDTILLNMLALVQYSIKAMIRAFNRIADDITTLTPERGETFLNTHPLARILAWGPGGPTRDKLGLVEDLTKKLTILAALIRRVKRIEVIGAPDTSMAHRRSDEVRGTNDHLKQSGDEVRIFDRTLLITLQFLDKSPEGQLKRLISALFDRAIGAQPQSGQSEALFRAHDEKIREWKSLWPVVVRWTNVALP